MALTDTYKTIRNTSEGIYREKGSKFLSFAFPVINEDVIKENIQKIKQKYFDATHHCYAWKLGIDDNHFKINDDGEPSGTAGKPVLGQIKSRQLTNILIVVVRYFGGIKLGTSGLINAYKSAASDVIMNAAIIEKTVNDHYNIFFQYSAMNDVMKIVKDENAEIIDRQFGLNCSLNLSIRHSNSCNLISKLQKVETVKIEHLFLIGLKDKKGAETAPKSLKMLSLQKK